MYAAFIVFLVPALALLLNILLCLLVSLVMYAAFRARIGREEAYLATQFGEDYARYAPDVPAIYPLHEALTRQSWYPSLFVPNASDWTD